MAQARGAAHSTVTAAWVLLLALLAIVQITARALTGWRHWNAGAMVTGGTSNWAAPTRHGIHAGRPNLAWHEGARRHHLLR